jgi:hypothetical protein
MIVSVGGDRTVSVILLYQAGSPRWAGREPYARIEGAVSRGYGASEDSWFLIDLLDFVIRPYADIGCYLSGCITVSRSDWGVTPRSIRHK